MTVDEIFSELSAHMIKGMMTHEQLANYYDFLNLRGYKRCHEYRYLKESVEYRKLCRYYINHYNKLIPYRDVGNPDIIPDSWYRYSRQDVDASIKRTGVKNGIEAWVKWERETKDLYQERYADLMKLGEVAAAEKLAKYIHEVDCELKQAERKMQTLSTIGYDVLQIEYEQDCLHDRYRHKMEDWVIKL